MSSLREYYGLKMSFCPDLRGDQSQIDLIQSHYIYIYFSKLIPHAWIAIVDVKDLTYTVSKST